MKKTGFQDQGKENVYQNIQYVGIWLAKMCLSLCLPSSGTYAVMSVMIGGVAERLAPDSKFMDWNNVTNSSINIAARDEERVRVVAAVTFMSGLFQVNLS